ncbi:efflux RND transporter periplasmic adaptor subunit [Microcoleus sp. LEGE 07076]|uniref:efflux RND transporter periplasmic adaptor subunit n=1 Tax=Microcoleus sp. LEGE 07076 TaxID=915322 RepID=UPI001D14AED7|nr:efflux RND transporter periplasmic adaptor subunit [Microcoleus sp. LEGE 07076]
MTEAETQIQTARAGIESAQQQVLSAQAQVSAARKQAQAKQSSIKTARARLWQTKVALEKASIVAPFDGIVAYLNISEGEYFTPQSVSSQLGGDYQGILEPIPMVIIDPSRYEVQVELSESTGEGVRSGQEALVASKSALATASPQTSGSEALTANARAKGEVFAVNPAISPGGRAIEAKIRLNPTTNAVRHGEQVLTWIAIAENSDDVVVPLNAVVRRDRVPYVFVVAQKGVVEQRQVELGITGIAEQEIKEGVAAGDLVVTEGQNRLVNGASVQVVEGNQK